MCARLPCYLLEAVVDCQGDHDDECQSPAHGDGLVGVRQRLPGPRVQRSADGEVALQGDGHQREAADTHGDRWTQQSVDIGNDYDDADDNGNDRGKGHRDGSSTKTLRAKKARIWIISKSRHGQRTKTNRQREVDEYKQAKTSEQNQEDKDKVDKTKKGCNNQIQR